MSISSSQLNSDVWIVNVSGRLDQSQSYQLERDILELIDDGHTKVIVDMSEVGFVNSGGLRSLVTGWRQARQQGGNVYLCGLNARITEIFEIVGFHKVFNIYASSDNALSAFKTAD